MIEIVNEENYTDALAALHRLIAGDPERVEMVEVDRLATLIEDYERTTYPAWADVSKYTVMYARRKQGKPGKMQHWRSLSPRAKLRNMRKGLRPHTRKTRPRRASWNHIRKADSPSLPISSSPTS